MSNRMILPSLSISFFSILLIFILCQTILFKFYNSILGVINPQMFILITSLILLAVSVSFSSFIRNGKMLTVVLVSIFVGQIVWLAGYFISTMLTMDGRERLDQTFHTTSLVDAILVINFGLILLGGFVLTPISAIVNRWLWKIWINRSMNTNK